MALAMKKPLWYGTFFSKFCLHRLISFLNTPRNKAYHHGYISLQGTAMSFLLDEPTIRSRFAPITPEQYRLMGESGLLQSNVELINGFILEKMPKTPLHTITVSRLQAALLLILSQEFSLRKEEPLALVLSEPEPDIAIVYGAADNYAERHPKGAETVLVVEVALSSLALDRKKAELYANAGIPCYWLVNLHDRTVEVYTEPHGAVYSSCEVIQGDDVLLLSFGTFGTVSLPALFPSDSSV